MKILLADDHDVNRQIIRAYLRQTDCRIEEVANGEEALEKVKAQLFDLVLMDIGMAVMDGYTATRAIRSWEKANGKPPVPIVALTAHVYDEDVKKSFDAGCNAHLGKPIERRILLETITNLTATPHVTVEADIKHLVPLFMEDMTVLCKTIEAAATVDDLEAVTNASHRIKGTGGVFGFYEISQIGADLEVAATAGDCAETKRLSAKLTKHLAEVKINYK